ncbi:uncharacterized protein CEXT_705131 [Caerostris extrusa]|uniref:Uncharacterized protein n=1 Tax=Caerostris extrusa TaxID=172846 RepID=A0AAV4NW45_CAEEX|nr:uncharacterized protein CEXT_705131 [Caerostris extrusa]
MIDSEKGWYDMDNVYTCEENQRCCKEYGNPSCCAEKNKWLIVKDQLVLWGGLLVSCPFWIDCILPTSRFLRA